MSFSRDRQELAEDYAARRLPTADCAGCAATLACIRNATSEAARPRNPGEAIGVVEGWMRSYAASVEGCVGIEACMGAELAAQAAAPQS